MPSTEVALAIGLAAFGLGSDPGSRVNGPTLIAAVDGGCLCGMEPDADPWREPMVAPMLHERQLDLTGARHRGSGPGEREEEPIARLIHLLTTVAARTRPQ